jgi:membrane-bound metal-dependent hydrolase YbcI (DUF457 family)
MDNLCHTLAGLALGEAGLRRRTPMATATLVIGANLPDLDGLVYLVGGRADAFAFRRGLTHGILALAIWPFLLAGLMLAWDRWMRLRRRPDSQPASPGGLLLIAAIAVASHPFLDWMNTYGMRWLMPFSDRWYHGDTLFIIDPWIWLALTAGVVGARIAGAAHAPIARGQRLARLALALVSAYIGMMAALNATGRAAVRRELAARGVTPEAIMVAPVPANPLRRNVVAATATAYLLGSVRGADLVTFTGDSIGRLSTLPSTAAAAQTPAGRAFMGWARFPYYVHGPAERCPLGYVCIRDARYHEEGWAEVAIPVVSPVSLAATATSGEPQ